MSEAHATILKYTRVHKVITDLKLKKKPLVIYNKSQYLTLTVLILETQLEKGTRKSTILKVMETTLYI